MVTYNKPGDFLSIDEYAEYVREWVREGQTVVCCRPIDEIQVGDVGRVLCVQRTYGLHHYNVQVKKKTIN